MLITCILSCRPLQVPPSLAVTEPSAAAASTAGASAALRCVLERSRRLCLRLYEKELLTDTTALEGAAKWVLGDGELGLGVGGVRGGLSRG